MTSEFAIQIEQWYNRHKRDLPWRQTTNPYYIWLSEIILQQTRVEQGRAYYERFVQTFPTVQDLASATEESVLLLWQGLGYYSRARNLHFAAKQIVAMGGFPHTLDEIKSLKGVGDYTAAAVGSIAFGLPAAVVDGNVYRVLSRYFGVETPINTTEGKKTFTALAQSLLPPKEASAYNQAIMDFGAIQCTPQSPQCGACPLQESCVAFREDRVGTLPVKLKTLKVKERRLSYVYIRCKGCVAIHRRGAGDIWQGLYEPYLVAEDNNGIDLQQCLLLKKDVRHVLTHRILLADFYLLETAVRPELVEDYIWVQEQDLEKYGVPRLVELLYEEVRAVLGNRK